MKKRTDKKGRLREALVEGVLELVLTVIFFAIGWGILSLFGMDTDKMDPDLTVLIGIAVLAVVVGAVAVMAHFVKKKRCSHSRENDKEE